MSPSKDSAMRLAARVELLAQGTAGSGFGGQKEQGGRGGGAGKKMGGQGPARGNVQLVDTVAAIGGQQAKKGKGQQAGNQQGQKKKPPCFACQGPHYLRDCPVFKATQEALKKKKQGN